MMKARKYNPRQVTTWLLSIASFVSIAKAQNFCPAKCKCSEDQLVEVGPIYYVNCNEKDLLQVPDLTMLSTVSRPIYLNLGNNHLSTVSSTDFPPGLNVFRLDLDQNTKVNINDDAFVNFATTLRRLTLDAVGLAFHRPLEMVSSLGSLEELSISYNNKKGYINNGVSDVEVVLFQSDWPVVKSLKILRMTHSGIRSLSPATLDTLIALRELDLSNNWLTSVPSAVKHLKELKKLVLFHAGINMLEDYTFLGLTNLETIELTTNSLKTIEHHAFIGLEKSLKVLRLDSCHLQKIPSEAMKELAMLEYIDLSQNSFSSAPFTSFVGKYCVKELLVSSEGLQFQQLTFSGQKNCVTDLTIKRMKLKIVPREALAELDKLVRLSLEYNQISELPKDAFKGIKATSINLANNPLIKIDSGAFLGLQPHLDLNLRRTHVADIDFLLGYPDDAIDTVNLDYTKLECRCSMKSALNATLSVEIYGSCTKGVMTVPLSSSRLEGILDNVCKEEQANNYGQVKRAHHIILYLLLTMFVFKLLPL